MKSIPSRLERLFVIVVAAMIVGCKDGKQPAPAHAVAFETMEGPELIGQGLLPDVCRIWRWVIEFFPTQSRGVNLASSAQTGQIIQKVEVIKQVFRCDGTPDLALSSNEVFWEYFNVVDGRTEGSDNVQVVFPNGRRTTVELVLSAGYFASLDGVAPQTINPLTNPGGASGRLSAEPPGFSATATLVRRLTASVNCCETATTSSWTAQATNIWESYSETWQQQDDGPVEHQKSVDDEQIQDQ